MNSSPQKSVTDTGDVQPYGTFAPGRVGRLILSLTRGAGTSWTARKTRIVLRRLSGPWVPETVDTVVFGSRVRLHRKGNNCERSALYAPSSCDLREREILAGAGSPGAVFVDIGANVGLYSLHLARVWSGYPGARVLSIEPHPAIRGRLLFNLSLNPDLPVEVSDAAITAAPGAARLRTGRTNLGETRVSPTGDIEVRANTLLDELGRWGIQRVDALKVDVEGYEDQALAPFLRDAPEALIPRVVVVENNPREWKEDLPAWLHRRGLRLSERTRNNLLFTRPFPATR